jgi:hypothetical protein
VALLAWAFMAMVVGPSVASAADDPDPAVFLARQRVAVDSEVLMSGVGLEPGTLVTAVVCGNRARRGSLDCALSGLEAGVHDDGTFSAVLHTTAPPLPCPCVVVVAGATPEAITTPIRLLGHPLNGGGLGPRTHATGRPEIVVGSAELEGGSSLATWFGAAGEATLNLTLRNEGNLAGVPRLDLGWGPSGTEPTLFVDAPELPALEPGRTATVRIPVSLDALGHGEQVVAGTVRAGTGEMAFSDSVSVRPWALYALALVLVLAVPLALLARYVRRLRVGEDRCDELPAEEVLGVPYAPIWFPNAAVGERSGRRTAI